MSGHQSSAVGACTWIYGARDPSYVAGRLAALGMDGAEIFVDPRECDPARLRQVFDDNGLRLFTCTPHNVDLADPRPEVRAAALEYYHLLVELAADAGIGAINCHDYIDPDAGSDRPYAAVVDRLAESCRTICRRAADVGVTVAYEPLSHPSVHIRTAAQAMTLADAVDSAAFKIVLDTYHMHRAETDPVAAIRACRDRLFAVQLADSARGGIGSGEIDFTAQFQELTAIGFAGPMILECTTLPGPGRGTVTDEPALEAALRTSHAWLRRWWKSTGGWGTTALPCARES